jgi:hypothetical protein
LVSLLLASRIKDNRSCLLKVSAIDRTVLERYGNTPFAEAAWNFDARRSILLEETKESRSLSIDLVGETYRTALEAGGMIEVRNGKKRVSGPIFNRSRSRLNIS